MAQKHKIVIWCEDSKAPDWRVNCSGCSCNMTGFGGPGPAEKAADRYHAANGTTITSIKVK